MNQTKEFFDRLEVSIEYQAECSFCGETETSLYDEFATEMDDNIQETVVLDFQRSGWRYVKDKKVGIGDDTYTLVDGIVCPECHVEDEEVYEYYFDSKPGDPIQIQGWYPIPKSRIKDPSMIPDLIKKGVLRKQK